MKLFLLTFLLATTFAQEYFPDIIPTSDEVLADPYDMPKPPNSPTVACDRALSLKDVYKPWACNQYINWCYFNDINKGGLAKDYKGWPVVPNWSKSGTVASGISDSGHNHVAIICGGTLCHEPNHSKKPIVCRPVNEIIKYLFKSYTLHYPPGY